MTEVIDFRRRFSEFADRNLPDVVVTQADAGLSLTFGTSAVTFDDDYLSQHLQLMSILDNGSDPFSELLATNTNALHLYAQAVAAMQESPSSVAEAKVVTARWAAFNLLELTAEESDRVDRCLEPSSRVDDDLDGDKWDVEVQTVLNAAMDGLSTAAELHIVLHFYNLDDVDNLLPLVSHPNLDRGTALQLFWNKGFIEYLTNHTDEADEFELEGHSIAVNLLNRLESDQFQSKLFSFAADPYYLEISGLKYDIPDTLRQSIQGQYSGVRDPLSGQDTVQ